MKIFILIATSVVFLIGTWFLFWFVFKKKNDAAEYYVTEFITQIENFYKKNDSLSDDFSMMTTIKKVKDSKVLLFFSIPLIKYKLSSDKQNYRIYYYESPLGPYHGYDSIENDWFYEE